MKLDKNDIEKIRHYEEKRGIKYIKTTDKVYKALLFLAFIIWIYAMLMSLFYILGSLIISGKSAWDNSFNLLFILFIISLVTPVIYAIRFKITAIIINFVTMIIQFSSFAKITTVDGNSSSDVTVYEKGFLGLRKVFYIRHGIPILLLTVILLIIAFIIIRERLIIKKEYAKISNNEYISEILPEDE